jgi:large subunit ribosomal protein L29
MKAAEIREYTQDELMRALEDSRRELFNLRMQAQTGQLENTARIRLVRRDIARLLTEQGARSNVQSNA